MKAAILTGRQTIELRDIRTPPVGPNELLVDVEAVGICGSDIATFNGCHPYKRSPTVLGHELCGRVSCVGDNVSSFERGDRVCSMSYAPCMACSACDAQETQLCSQKRALSHNGMGGAFGEQVMLDCSMLFHIPDGVSSETGALVEPLSIGLHAIKLAGPDLQRIAILGSGSIGLSTLVAAKHRGAQRIVTTDLGSIKGERVIALGASDYVDAREGSVAERVVSALGGAADVVLIAADAPGILDDAIQIARRGGTVVVISYFERPILLNANVCVQHEIQLRFSCMSNPADCHEVIGWLESNSVDPGLLISHRFTLADAAAAMRVAASGDSHVGKVMLIMESDCKTERMP